MKTITMKAGWRDKTAEEKRPFADAATVLELETAELKTRRDEMQRKTHELTKQLQTKKRRLREARRKAWSKTRNVVNIVFDGVSGPQIDGKEITNPKLRRIAEEKFRKSLA